MWEGVWCGIWGGWAMKGRGWKGFGGMGDLCMLGVFL